MGIEFIGPFVTSYGMRFILVEVDYVYKYVEAVVLPNNEERGDTAFLKKHIFVDLGFRVLLSLMVGRISTISY